MKKLLLSVTLICLMACKKENAATNGSLTSAVITGQDFRKCWCCGGWFIEIGSDTFRFKELPAGAKIDLDDAAFPLPVKVKWKLQTDPCMSDLIDIQEIEQ